MNDDGKIGSSVAEAAVVLRSLCGGPSSLSQTGSQDELKQPAIDQSQGRRSSKGWTFATTATTNAKPEATAARFDEPEPAPTRSKAKAITKEPAGRPALRKTGALRSSAGGIVADAVEQTDDRQDCAPPDAGVQVVEDHLDDWRMGNLVNSGAKNQHAIDQQRNSYEEPDRNCTVRSHGPHQNIILSAMNTMATITAQNAGL
jgi:hypothetical protein